MVNVTPATSEVQAEFYGAGADWLAWRLPDLIGESDDPTGFSPPPELAAIWQRRSGMRVPKSRLVFESLVPVVLGQKVTGIEARNSYRRLVVGNGDPVGCGPFPELLVPPLPVVWASIPSWEWHVAGVGP